jgi:hypothetical protein
MNQWEESVIHYIVDEYFGNVVIDESLLFFNLYSFMLFKESQLENS